MASETEKKLLQKLKEDLEKPKPDAFESGDLVDNLKQEFKEHNGAKAPMESKPFSMKELSEEDLEKELVEEGYKKSEEDLLESETMMAKENKDNSKTVNPKIEEKIVAQPEEKKEEIQPKPEEKPVSTAPAEQPAIQPEPEKIQAPPAPGIPPASEAKAPEPIVALTAPPTPTPPPIAPKKKSKLPLILLIIFLPIAIIAGIVVYYLFFM